MKQKLGRAGMAGEQIRQEGEGTLRRSALKEAQRGSQLANDLGIRAGLLAPAEDGLTLGLGGVDGLEEILEQAGVSQTAR
ncbi:MAG TPA: hypothetical protein VGR38_09080, partial [Candidatus Polarisedimenticolia bacterium]|nr:hypothetical protein [Candidatus Polarisedimenticolia bacterium]